MMGYCVGVRVAMAGPNLVGSCINFFQCTGRRLASLRGHSTP